MLKCEGDLPEASSGLLSPGDAFPAAVYNLGGTSPFLLLGDHSGRDIPRKLGDLGVSPTDMDRHIAWDIGVAGLGVALSGLLDATFIRQIYSRLVVDCNRTAGADDWIVPVSDGTSVPGNHNLNAEQTHARRDEIYMPYHARIAAELDARTASGRRSVLVSLHSFTPKMNDQQRPWRFGILHRNDSAFSQKMLIALRARSREPVGDNEPYKMDGTDFTIPHHVDSRGIEYTEIEMRQDTIADEASQKAAAAILAAALQEALAAYDFEA